jgi:hypothetical protein
MKIYLVFLSLLWLLPAFAQDNQSKSTAISVEMVSSTEDLMREHGDP